MISKISDLIRSVAEKHRNIKTIIEDFGDEFLSELSKFDETNFPCLVINVPEGSVKGSQDNLLNELKAGFMVLLYAPQGDLQMQKNAVDTAYAIGNQVFNRIYERTDFPVIEDKSFAWYIVGPIATGEYGVNFEFKVLFSAELTEKNCWKDV